MSRTLVRYTIPLDSGSRFHRLGVNSLAIDPTNGGTLYSGGRDGLIAAWDLSTTNEMEKLRVDSVDNGFKHGIQAHTNWVNQIAISPDYESIYSCSSDTLVKCWRPNASEPEKANVLGSHGDYVKCLVKSKNKDEWVATAGLDRAILMWDLSGKGEKMRIDDASIDGGMKQSIYSLATGPSILASGGIEKVIRVWDTRSGARITKFVGHTDNVRSLLCSEDGKVFISAASDTTIKIWDLTAGRCLHTLTKHADPVWTLDSDHPDLAVFHSADRTGLILKHDIRPQSALTSDGHCHAICKESSGVHSIAKISGSFFAATASSSINRWKDFEVPDTDPFADPGETLARMESGDSSHSNREMLNMHRSVSYGTRKGLRFGLPSALSRSSSARYLTDGDNTASSSRKISLWSHASVVSLAHEDENTSRVPAEMTPIQTSPEYTIQGQAGLIAHDILPDRRRVLTRDTQGKVKVWDITQCRQIQDFGTAEMEDVSKLIQTPVTVGSWCSVNTRIGALTIELDPRNMLDAETYFDDISNDNSLDFETRNQRFNLGKWMLKNLFVGVLQAEMERDLVELEKLRRKRPNKLNLGDLSSMRKVSDGQETPRASATTPTFGSRNPYASAMSTPGAAIGLATPAPTYNPRLNGNGHQSEGSVSSQASSKGSPTSPMTPHDYFSSPHGTKDPDATPMGTEPSTPGGSQPKTSGGSGIMKNMKWLRSNKSSKTPSSEAKKQSAVAEEMPSTTPIAAKVKDAAADGPILNYQDLVKQCRRKFVNTNAQAVPSTGISNPTWMATLEPMPVLRLPSNIEVSLAELRPGEGEAKDIYRGTVGNLGSELEQVAPFLPLYIGQILLLNETPTQMQNLESNKHYFSFVPHIKSQLQDPFNTSSTNLMRLGAARSLRIRKALTYISQRLPAEIVEKEGAGQKEEAWLEIIINGAPVDPGWTLMMARRHLWKQGGDMRLEYKLKSE